VQPQALLRGHVGDGVEWVDGAGVRRTRARYHTERHAPGCPVRGDGRAERVDVHALSPVGRHRPYRADGESRQPGRLGHRLVGLVGDVEGAGEKVLREAVGPRGHDRREHRQRSAAGENALGAAGEVEEAGQPAEQVLLHRDQGGGREGDPRVAVEDVGEKVRDGAADQAAAGNEGQVAGARRVEPLRRRPVQQLEQLRQWPAPLARRPAQLGIGEQLRHAVVVARRGVRQRGKRPDYT
jgi:hypothetical protein